MSKEVFLLPSAKQILSYENGDIRSDELSTVYRFHFLNTYIWIEPSNKGYDIKVRGKFPVKGSDVVFVPTARIIETTWDLPSAVSFFKNIVKNFFFLHDMFCEEGPDFDWKV